ncbi:MAG: hypothetical protein B7Z37_09705 [Verrucomicrobia bacterium 12-59-8]|nr:MAG: hypothetical protein B7Z37_09705 [Verrucomicrobia bacterium 12-59-8]
MKTPHPTPRTTCAAASWSAPVLRRFRTFTGPRKAPASRRSPNLQRALAFVIASLRSLLRSSTRFAVLAVSLCSALHSSSVIAAEPTRQELWVPTKDLDTVLKAHPNAIMLSPEQYEALIRDAGKTQPAEDPKLAPPKIIAIEGLRLEGQVEPGAASVTLRGELTLQLPSKDWLSTKFAWPFDMGSVTSEGNVLAYVEAPQRDMTTTASELVLFAKGPGTAKLRFEARVPVWLRLRAGEHTLEVPEVPFGGVLNLTLPAGVRLLAGSAYERQGDTLKVAFDHRGYNDTESTIKHGAPRAFRVRWMESPPAAAAQPLRFSATAEANVSVSESNVATSLRFGVRVQENSPREAEIEWQLVGKDTQVTDVSGMAVRRWRQDGAKLFVTLERDGGMHDLTVNLRRLINSVADAGELPLLALNPPLRTRASLQLAQDLDFLDLTGAKPLARDQFEFQLGVDQPRLVLRTSKPRIESDVDVIARIDKDSVQIERKLVLRSDRSVTEVKLTLPPGEEFITILSTPVGSTLPSSTSQQLVVNSSQALMAYRLTWRRVGQTLTILPVEPIVPASPLEFSVTSRLKLTKAWTGPKNPETITVHQLDIPDAVKVAGYTALDFDDAWRVALKEAKGLEDRDARLTPVKGRMAWFGLREHALTFEVERAESVFSTEVTAYALPRARTIEIEGQFTLDISGAPLRTFQVKLPVENAKLLRVTSPLVGEQQLDEATGVWTCTLRQESKGRQNIRWRMSLPSNGGIPARSEPAAPTNQTLTATLPHLEFPQSRRFAGTWIIEANTDTQLSTKIQNMQPLDVLRVPVVADYQPRHRITSAFTYGAGDNALTITAQRHAHSELAALVVNRMALTSVLGTDGHSLHEATLDLSHSGEQFVSLHLPQDAELLSTSSGGQAVKPVRSVENAIAIPLPAGSANALHTLVQVQYRQQKPVWGRSGTQNLEPIRLVGNVPVLSTDWAVYAPGAFGYAKVDTTLEQSHVVNDADDRGFLSRLASVLGKPLGWGSSFEVMAAPADFLADRPNSLLPPLPNKQVEEARADMSRGDKQFGYGGYGAALESYRSAVQSLENAPMAENWLNLAKLKQVDCSVAVAQEWAKQKVYDQARQLLNEALQLVPGHKSATTMLQQLNDPSRWPSTSNAEVMKVQSGLLLANTSVEIGNYDAAISQYQDVLRTDPYNSAARRGIENAERRRQAYFKTAYDHQRAKMLAQVSEGWEDKVPEQGASIAFDYGVGRSPGAFLTEKMNKIIIPTVQLQDATIEEAIEYLRVKSRDLDTFTDASGTKGVSMILRTGNTPSNARITLDLKDVPLSEALRYVTELAQMKYKVETHAVLVVPLSENASEQFTRSYRVRPNFLSAGGGSRLTAKQALEGAGITFPEGASASYNPTNTTLVVRNTQPNLDLVAAFVDSVVRNEMHSKSGLIPLDVELPETGRLLRFHGAQPPEMLALHYTSWSQQMVRAVLAMAVGLALFWRFGRRRPWFLTLLVLVLTAWGMPLLLEGTLLALTNAVAFGWICALALHSLGWLFAVTRPQMGPLRSFVIRHSAFVIFLTLASSLSAENPPPDPAAHTVIIPYDAKLPLDAQKAERFYLGYDEFQRLWKLAKENRRALPADTDATQHAVIHSALYQGRIEERGLVLEARITATTRGEWTKLLLPFAQIENGKDTTQGLVGEVRVDGKSAALSENLLTLEQPGTHAIELTATLPLAHDWNDLTLRLPPALSGMLSLHTPKSDGWLRVNGAAATTVEEQASGRRFTQTLGTHREVRLQRSARGLERGEGPVPAATVRGTLTLRELEPETLDAEIEYEFPGAVRRTLEFAVDDGGLEIGTLNTYTTIPSAGMVRVPTMTTQVRRSGGKLVFTITLRHEVSHGAVMRIEGAQRFLHAAGVRTTPVIQPLAQRLKQEMALLHDDSMKVKVNASTAQRTTNADRNGLLDAGRWQWTGTTAPTYDVQPAALFAEADVSYVFQLSEQKAELLAALTLKRKRGLWTRAVVGLPADYEVQAVQGPALTAWQHEGSQLYLQLDPNIAGPEARVVVHLAKVAAQPVTTWKLEPLKLENYEKISGKALIVAHAANDVKLPNPTQLKELDVTVLDSVFAIAPPMEKKRALQYEGAAWSVDVALTRQPSRFSAETMLLVLASDAGIRISQQVVALVEQGALRQLSVRLPAALPEAVVSGPLLRETRSHIEGADRIYECSLQTEVLDRAELTFDLDLPLTAELDVPFVKVADASRLTRWFVLDNTSSRESKTTQKTALETVARETLPYLPTGLARPQFFRATGDGALKLAYQQLTSTEGNAALITLADLTTVLRPDGSRWDIAQYSLINRSLQFLPVLLPDKAELISVSVSGEPVRADEETQNGKRVRLIPLIHTRPGQRALEVKMIYRFAQGSGLQQSAKLDDPEIVGLSVERTTWTVWTPQGWNLKDFDGNMTANDTAGRELLQLEGMLSELGEANRALSSGKLDYGDAEAAYRDANALAHMVQEKKRELMSKAGRGSLMLSRRRDQQSKMDTEVEQQQELLKGNWDNNYASRKATTKGGKDAGKIEQGKTSWGMNSAAPQQQPLRLAGSNTFSGSITTNGGQLFNDNVAVDNTYFANSASPYGGGPITAGNRSGGFSINNASIDSLLTGSSQTSQILTQNATGSVNTVNSNARSNNLGNGSQVAMPRAGATAIAGSGGVAMEKPAESVLFDRKEMQTLPGGGAGVAFNSAPLIRADNNAGLNTHGMGGTSGMISNSDGLALGNERVFSNLSAPGTGSFAISGATVASNTQTTVFAAVNTSAPPQVLDMPLVTPTMDELKPAAAPAMGADPFGAPATPAAPPPAMGGDPFGAPAAVDALMKADDDGKELPRILAQTVESLRPTGRRALGIELPLNGTAHHFSKLKDHAVLEIALKRVGDPKTTSRLLCLTGGLLLWLAIGWKLKRHRSTV